MSNGQNQIQSRKILRYRGYLRFKIWTLFGGTHTYYIHLSIPHHLAFVMEDEPTEEQFVARERVNKVLQKFDKVMFNLTYFYYETGRDTEGSLYLPTQLFIALKNCERHCNYDVFFKIWKLLADNEQCSKQFMWKMFVNVLQRDEAKLMPFLSEVAKVMYKWQRIHRDEVKMVNMVAFLKREMYGKAKEEASKFTGKKRSTLDNCYEVSRAAASSLLTGYKTMLDCQDLQPDDDEAHVVMRESFDQLVSMDTCVPLYAETYVCVLMQSKLQEEAEIFLRRYVEKECQGNIAILPALHALNIMKLHMPKASLGVTVSFLEMIAIRSPGDAKVLELCQHYLHVHNSGINSQSDTESDLDFGSDNGAVSFAHKSEGLSKCLQLIMYFLDEHIFNLPSAVIREGWSIMADTMRRICVQGTDDYLRYVVELWHNDRKRWWPCFRLPRTGLSSTLAHGDAEFLSNKGFVCYVLESRHHPFVVSLMEHSECRLLNSLVKQLSHQKIMLDSKIERILRVNGPILPIPLISPPAMLRGALTDTQTPGNRFNPRFEFIDSELKAKEVTNYLLTSKPLKGRGEYRSLAKVSKVTTNILQLPIDDLLAKRYEHRKKATIQSKILRMTRSSRSAALSAGGSVCSLESLDSVDTSLDLSGNDTDDPDMDDDRFPPCDPDDDGISNLSDLDPHHVAKIECAKQRWREFFNSGLWEPLSEDEITDCAYAQLASDDEYAPSYCSDDSDFSHFTDQENQGEIDSHFEECNMSSIYTASRAPSDILNSLTSSLASVSTPLLQFSNVPSQPREIIRNVDHHRFMEFDSISMRSNSTTTDEIADSINRVIRKLDVDLYAANTSPHPSRWQQEAEEYVVEEDIEIPEEALVQGECNAISGVEPNSDGDVMEENASRPELSFGSNLNRSFSRNFGASSPDMFASSSENEVEVEVDSAVSHPKAPVHRNTAIFAPMPIAGSTPKAVHKAKSQKDSNAQSEVLHLKNKSKKKTGEKIVLNSSPARNHKRETTATSNHKSYKSIVNTQEESRALQEVLAPTSELKRLSPLGPKTNGIASWDQSKILHPEVEVPETVNVVRKKKRLPSNAPKGASTFAFKEKSSSNTNRLVDAESVEVSFSSAMEPPKQQLKKSRIGSAARKCHTRIRDPTFLSESDNESGVSVSKALPRKKATVKSKKTIAVSSEENMMSKLISEILPAKETPVEGKKTKRSTKTKSNGKKELATSDVMNSSDSLSADALIEQILAESKSFNSMIAPGVDKPKTKGTRRKLSTESGPPKKAKRSEEPIGVARSVENILAKYLGDEEAMDKSKEPTSKKPSLSKAWVRGKSSDDKSSLTSNTTKSKSKKTKLHASDETDASNAESVMKTSTTAKKKSTNSVIRESDVFDPLSFVEQLWQESLRNSLPPSLPMETKAFRRRNSPVEEPKSVAKRPSKQRKANS